MDLHGVRSGFPYRVWDFWIAGSGVKILGVHFISGGGRAWRIQPGLWSSILYFLGACYSKGTIMKYKCKLV